MPADIELPPRWGWRITAALIGSVFFGAAVGLFLLFLAYTDQRARDLITWQVRMGAVAEGQALELGRWINRRFAILQALAENASLQIYVTQISQRGDDRSQRTVEPAQRQYLRNLLTVEAERGGFADRPRASEAFSNVRSPGHAGLAILDADKRLLIATADMPPFEGTLAARLAALPTGQRGLLDLFPLTGGIVAVGFIEPIYGMQAGPGPDRLIGYVLGVLSPGADFFAMLKLSLSYAPTAASTLVRHSGSMIEYLSPADDTARPLERRLSDATPDLDTAFAATHPGGFAEKTDYRGTRVLVTGRAVANTPWTVVHTVSADVALAETEAGAKRNVAFLLLGVLLAIASIVAAWRHGASRRLAALADQFRALADRYNHLWLEHRLVTDTQSDPIFIVDAEGRVQFANRAFGERLELSAQDAVGKQLDALIGPAAAAPIRAKADRCFAQRTEARLIQQEETAGAPRIIQTTFVLIPEDESSKAAVLVVEHDITAALQECEQRERMLSQLVAALMSAIDLRDPYAAHQSAQVAAVSRGTAVQLGLDDTLVVAAELVGRLMNFGKVLIPAEVLTTTEPLSTQNRELIQDSIAATADIISRVESDGPVVPALRAVTERWDGTGPRGLKGDDIPVLAQVAGAANLFVAAASTRAYREAGGLDRGMAELQAESGKAFDRRVVSALAHFIDNQGGKALFDTAKPADS